MKNRNLVSLMIVLFSSQPCLVTFDIGSMIDGMGTSFGAPPTGYIYSWEVWNDASVPIHVEQEGIASFMGAYFPSAKGFYNKKTLPSIFDAGGAVSKGEYHNQDYYFKFYIGPNSDVHTDYAYKESLTQLPLKKNDTKIYYYHVYTSPSSFDKGNAVHKPAVECMGWNDPTTTNFPDPKIQPSVKLSNQVSSIAFYNSSGTDVQVSLSYGPNPYKFTVEKYSYNSLAVPTPQEKKSSDSSSGTTPTPAAKSNVSIQGIGDSTTQAAAEIVATTTDSLDSLSALTEVALPPLFSLRPNTITFSAYDAASGTYKAPFRTVQLPSQGFDGCAYTFEIFQDPGQTLEVGVQGL